MAGVLDEKEMDYSFGCRRCNHHIYRFKCVG